MTNRDQLLFSYLKDFNTCANKNSDIIDLTILSISLILPLVIKTVSVMPINLSIAFSFAFLFIAFFSTFISFFASRQLSIKEAAKTTNAILHNKSYTPSPSSFLNFLNTVSVFSFTLGMVIILGNFLMIC